MEKLPYYEYAMQGLLSIVPGEYIEKELVFDWFKRMGERYNIVTIGYDVAQATTLVRMLKEHGFACEVVRQGAITCNAPMKDIREKLLDGKIVMNRNPLFCWYLGNVRLRRNILRSGEGKLVSDQTRQVPKDRRLYGVSQCARRVPAYQSAGQYRPGCASDRVQPVRLGGKHLNVAFQKAPVTSLLPTARIMARCET